jgi:hypothetical protein
MPSVIAKLDAGIFIGFLHSPAKAIGSLQVAVLEAVPLQ